MMRVIERVEELSALVGTRLGVGDWIEVDQQRIDAFAEVTGDGQWIHIDRVRASRGPFGTTVAHGYLSLSLIPALVATVYRVRGVVKAINYGLERVRFPAPLSSGSRVRATVDLIAIDLRQGGARLHTGVAVEREAGGRPVLVAEPITLLCCIRADGPATDVRVGSNGTARARRVSGRLPT